MVGLHWTMRDVTEFQLNEIPPYDEKDRFDIVNNENHPLYEQVTRFLDVEDLFPRNIQKMEFGSSEFKIGDSHMTFMLKKGNEDNNNRDDDIESWAKERLVVDQEDDPLWPGNKNNYLESKRKPNDERYPWVLQQLKELFTIIRAAFRNGNVDKEDARLYEEENKKAG